MLSGAYCTQGSSALSRLCHCWQRLSEVTLISVVLMQIEEYLTTGTLQALSPEEDAKKAKEKQEAAAEVEKSAAYAFL